MTTKTLLIPLLFLLLSCSDGMNNIRIKGSDTEVNLNVLLAEEFRKSNTDLTLSISGVILMDEPCSALDPISTSKIEELILELKNNYTVIIVTHNMQQAQRVADNTAFMYMGELIEMAPTKNIFSDAQQGLTKRYVEGRFG